MYFSYTLSPRPCYPIVHINHRNSEVARHIGLYTLLIALAFSCGQDADRGGQSGNLTDLDGGAKDATATSATSAKSDNDLQKLINTFEIKSIPHVDSTNFDNFHKNILLSREAIEILQLKAIYPEFDEPEYYYRVTSAYSLDLSKAFYTVVLTIFKGELELETLLINYGLAGKLLDHQIIAYDEIAEGMTNVQTKIESDRLTTTRIVWLEEKEETVEVYNIGDNGKIAPVVETL